MDKTQAVPETNYICTIDPVVSDCIQLKYLLSIYYVPVPALDVVVTKE